MRRDGAAITGPQGARRTAERAALLLVVAAVLVAAVLTRLGLLSAPPEFDELYHYLAALRWLESGKFAILDGSYARGSIFTVTAAWAMEVFEGHDLATARIASVVPGICLPAVLYLWVRSIAGLGAAVTAAVLAVLWPQGIVEAQLLRFYTLHVLLVFIGAISAYHAGVAQGPQRWIPALGAIISLGIASALQVTTLVVCLGLAIWLFGLMLLRLAPAPKRRLVFLGAACATGFVVLWVAAWTGQLERAWAIYRFAPSNALATKDYAAFYHNSLRSTYETLWPLFPVAVLIAIRVNATLALFCVTVFASVFVVQSFGAMKADRYISPVMPFFFVIWGMALVQIGGFARASLRGVVMPSFAAPVVLAFCGAFALLSNGFLISSIKLAAGGGYDARFRPDWSNVSEMLGTWSETDTLATTHELNTIMELGDYDVDLRPTEGWGAEFDEAELFGLDSRTGRYAVRGFDGYRALFDCRREGVLVTVESIWQGPAIGREFRRAAEEAGLNVETRREGSILAARWSDPAGVQPDCTDIPLD